MFLQSNDLDIVVWDVQHGNAIYIKTPNKKNLIIDLGTGSYGNNNTLFSPLLHLKNNWKLNQIDELIITHPDLDHIQDILNLKYFSVDCLVRPYAITKEDVMEKVNGSNREIFNKYIDLIDRFTTSVPYENAPRNPLNNGGVNINVYRPEPNVKKKEMNDFSIVTIIFYANSKIIIPGDNEESSWKWLLEKEEFRKNIIGTNIFFASHHGRKSGYYNELFNHISPKLVVISDGHVCDTSATDRYINKCKGWKVHYSGGDSQIRKCLTTRKDGAIHLKIGYNSPDRTFLEVKI